MEGILKFNLNDFDEQMAFRAANKANDMAIALFEILYNLKKKAYYQEQQQPDGDIVEWIFKEIHAVCSDCSVNIDELIR